MSTTRLWLILVLAVLGIGILAVLSWRLSLDTPRPALLSEVWPEQQVWQDLALHASSLAQAQTEVGPADSCRSYADKEVCQYWPGREQDFFAVVTAGQGQVQLVNVVARPGKNLGSPSQLLSAREHEVEVFYLDYWGRRDTLYLFAGEGFAVEVEEGVIAAVQYFSPMDKAMYQASWGRWYPRQAPVDSRVDILLSLLHDRNFRLGQPQQEVGLRLDRTLDSFSSGSCSRVRYSLSGDDQASSLLLKVDYSGDASVALAYEEKVAEVSLADVVREFGRPDLVLGDRGSRAVDESGGSTHPLNSLMLVYLPAGIQFTFGPAAGLTGSNREAKLDESGRALAGAELWSVALISYTSPDAYLADPCIAELRPGEPSSSIEDWSSIDPFPALGSPPPAPVPTPTPLAWTGPLLYDQVWRKPDQKEIPLYDLGAGKVRSISTPWPIYRVYDWSPDGCFLPYLARLEEGRGQLYLLNVSTLSNRLLLSDTIAMEESWSHLAWSSDGKWLATETPNDPAGVPLTSTLHLLQADGSEHWQVTLPRQDAVVLGWLRDSHTLIYRSRHAGEGPLSGRKELYDLELLNVDARLPPVRLARYQQPLESWSDLVITDAYTLRPVPLQLSGKAVRANLVQLYWTPDLRILVVMTARSLFYQYEGVNLYRVELPGGQMRQVNRAEFCAENITLAPDGVHLAFEGRCLDERDQLQAYLLDLVTGELESLVSPEGQSLYNPSWSPDGRMLALTQKDMTTRPAGRHYLYSLATGEMVPLDTNRFDYYDSLNWSPRMAYGPGACTREEQIP